MIKTRANAVRKRGGSRRWPKRAALLLTLLALILLAHAVIQSRHRQGNPPTPAAPKPPSVQFDFYKLLSK